MAPNLREEVKVEKEAMIGWVPTCILGSEVNKLCNKEVKKVRVQWVKGHENATRETEDNIRTSYHFLFDNMFLNFFF